MSFSKELFESAAEILADHYTELKSVGNSSGAAIVHDLTLEFADLFATHNPNFHHVRFLNAANPD